MLVYVRESCVGELHSYSAMCDYWTCSHERMQEKRRAVLGVVGLFVVPLLFYLEVFTWTHVCNVCVCVAIRWGSTRCEGGGHFSGACEKVWCRKVRVVKSSTCRYSRFWSLSFFPLPSLPLHIFLYYPFPSLPLVLLLTPPSPLHVCSSVPPIFPSPPSLSSSLLSVRRLEQQRRKERNEAHLYMTVEIYQEDDFQAHQRADLIDFDDVKGGWVRQGKKTLTFKVPWKESVYTCIYSMYKSCLPSSFRVWS